MIIDYKLLLVDPTIIDHAKKVSENNQLEEVKYYIDDTFGWNFIDRNLKTSTGWETISNEIRNYNIGTTDEAKKEIREAFNRLDNIIDLDFSEMLHNNGSEIDIYSVNYSSSMGENAIGQAISQESKNGSWWDIFWKKTNSTNDLIDSDKNTIIHEIGHSLGLSHPNNDPFNERWTTDDTVMSYNESEDGWDTWYSKSDLDALISIWGRENDKGFINFDEESTSYKILRTGVNTYAIKSRLGIEPINNIDNLFFTDKVMSVEEDIINVFNLIEGVDDITGKVYRLYRAAFGRFPDIEGYQYWIKNNQSGRDTYQSTCQSFILSEEFQDLYISDKNNEDYIENLYTNILERSYDQAGYEYWINQLNLGIESKSEVLMGFSESKENKSLFITETGLSVI